MKTSNFLKHVSIVDNIQVDYSSVGIERVFENLTDYLTIDERLVLDSMQKLGMSSGRLRHSVRALLNLKNLELFDNIIYNRLKRTVLMHDIGDCAAVVEIYPELSQSNCRGKEFLIRCRDLRPVAYNAVSCHGTLKYVDVECNYFDTLSTYIVDYCDIHSGASGEYLTIDERLSEVSVTYGPDSDIAKNMFSRREYYTTIDENILHFMKRYKIILCSKDLIKNL